MGSYNKSKLADISNIIHNRLDRVTEPYFLNIPKNASC